INETRKGITSWNELFEEAGVKSYPLPNAAELIINQIKSLFKYEKNKLTHAQQVLVEVFEDVDSVEDHLIDAYNPDMHFSLEDTKSIGFDNPCEVWFSEKCIAISKDVWEQLKEEEFTI